MKTQSQWLFEAALPSITASHETRYPTLEYETDRLFEAPKPPLPTPTLLLKPETVPTGLTLYVKFPLDCEKPAKPMTGIFIPPDYKATSKVDLILYLHGLNQKSINDIWNAKSSPHFALREALTASNKNVILVGPTLGPHPNKGERKFYTPGGFDAYLNYVMASLSTYGSHQKMGQRPTVGNIILACHSAGGNPMRKLALLNAMNTAKIRECWGFDCTYGRCDAELWAHWAKSNPSKKLYIYHGSSSTRVQAVQLRKLAMEKNLRNVQVAITKKSHNYVPITYFKERINAASFLIDR